LDIVCFNGEDQYSPLISHPFFAPIHFGAIVILGLAAPTYFGAIAILGLAVPTYFGAIDPTAICVIKQTNHQAVRSEEKPFFYQGERTGQRTRS